MNNLDYLLAYCKNKKVAEINSGLALLAALASLFVGVEIGFSVLLVAVVGNIFVFMSRYSNTSWKLQMEAEETEKQVYSENNLQILRQTAWHSSQNEDFRKLERISKEIWKQDVTPAMALQLAKHKNNYMKLFEKFEFISNSNDLKNKEEKKAKIAKAMQTIVLLVEEIYAELIDKSIDFESEILLKEFEAQKELDLELSHSARKR